MSYPNYVYSLFAFIGFILALIPLAWHLDAWNVGASLYMIWTAVACLNQFVNSVVWNGNTVNWAPVWCDISSRLIVGVSMAIPACSLCINRRLYHISRLQNKTITNSEKRREMTIDLAIGVGLPVMQMVVAYIPQGHRFNIFEDVGCFPVSYPTPVFIALVSVPPVLVGCITAVYSVLSIQAFYKRRERLKEIMTGHISMNTDRYARLMCLAGLEVACMVPLGSVVIWKNCTGPGGIAPWISWEDTHYNFSRVDRYPAAVWRYDSKREAAFEFNRWQVIICSFVFFIFFGFAEEARQNYKAAYYFTTARLRCHTGNHSPPTKTSNVTFADRKVTLLPPFNRPISVRAFSAPPLSLDLEPSSTRDSLDYFPNISKKTAEGQNQQTHPISTFAFFARAFSIRRTGTILPSCAPQRSSSSGGSVDTLPTYCAKYEDPPTQEKRRAFGLLAPSPRRENLPPLSFRPQTSPCQETVGSFPTPVSETQGERNQTRHPILAFLASLTPFRKGEESCSQSA